MKKEFFYSLRMAVCLLTIGLVIPFSQAQNNYIPTAENLQARQEFSDSRFGIFLHWGIYSTFAQGEWYLNSGKLYEPEYAKVADAFYPHRFNARQWVKAFKDAGAKYICFTTRHHDGFSMFETKYSDYNIVNATPFKRDVLKELADACEAEGIKLHLYYSHLDWKRDDYPLGRTGRNTGRTKESNWKTYYAFMNNQLTELLTNYGKIGAIWFDGWWDHDKDSIPFNWELPEQYELIHNLQPACLVGNNHHQSPFPGEDIQIFERDLPGENKAGLSGQEVGHLPLETCETMNGMWGYKVADQNYKSPKTLIHLLVNTAGKGANLLLNIGPQPNGELPATSLERLQSIGEWLKQYGESIYGTTAGDVPNMEWGTTTRKGDKQFIHILALDTTSLTIPITRKVKSAICMNDGTKVRYKQDKEGLTLFFEQAPTEIDYIVVLQTK